MFKVMRGKRVLVTGASTGIGAAIARLFARHGALIGLHYASNREAAEAMRAAIEAESGQAACFRADLLDAEAPGALLESFVGAFGGIEVLVNNAGGMMTTAHFLDLDVAGWERTLRLNLVAPAVLARYAFAFMRDHGGGRIINISSVSAKFGGSATSLPYSVAKGGLEVLTRGLAREGARHNVLVNAVRPGFIRTPFHEKFPKADLDARLGLIPLKRPGEPDDIARMALFLASDGGNFVTGEVFAVAGGE
jgi:3-oxoacyl-[acyl-carrier protein] reductase